MAHPGNPGESGLVAARVFGAGQAAEAAQYLMTSFLRSRAGSGLLTGPHIEVKLKLLF